MRRLKVIINNIKYNAVSQITAFVINFALLPFIVSHTGKEVYGAYILVVTFTGYLGLMDLGVGGATVKYIAEFASKDNDRKVNDIISVSLTFFTIIGILAAILLFIPTIIAKIIPIASNMKCKGSPAIKPTAPATK